MKYFFIFITATLIFTGCAEQSVQPKEAPVKVKVTKKTVHRHVAPPPKKKIELKEVQDDNYSPEYMYPDDKYKKDKLVEKKSDTSNAPMEKASASMSKEECVSMIGQEKFDKYTEMFGNEAASIKRCTLLKSMQQS
jgi:hypothetical protein